MPDPEHRPSRPIRTIGAGGNNRDASLVSGVEGHVNQVGKRVEHFLILGVCVLVYSSYQLVWVRPRLTEPPRDS
jgi:hypothetical protein